MGDDAVTPAGYPARSALAEPIGFESFFEANSSWLFAALGLVTGNRQDAVHRDVWVQHRMTAISGSQVRVAAVAGPES